MWIRPCVKYYLSRERNIPGLHLCMMSGCIVVDRYQADIGIVHQILMLRHNDLVLYSSKRTRSSLVDRFQPGMRLWWSSPWLARNGRFQHQGKTVDQYLVGSSPLGMGFGKIGLFGRRSDRRLRRGRRPGRWRAGRCRRRRGSPSVSPLWTRSILVVKGGNLTGSVTHCSGCRYPSCRVSGWRSQIPRHRTPIQRQGKRIDLYSVGRCPGRRAPGRTGPWWGRGGPHRHRGRRPGR